MQKLSESSGQNQVLIIVVKCATCLLECLEKVCEYINRHAYAYMAVSGESFCASAWHGFLLNLKHGLTFAFAQFLARLFILVGKLSIVSLNCLSLVLIMKYGTKDLDDI
jgi:hypothetical protein